MNKRTIKIIDYQKSWPQEFCTIAAELRELLPNAVSIDHIGSTSVPELAAKDIIDIQVTVSRLEPQILEVLEADGYQVRKEEVYDLLTGIEEQSSEMCKYFTREKKGCRRANIHIRKKGALNQQYALLFRDYLRSCQTTRQAYLEVKKRLAAIYPHDIEGYLSIKDPVMDIIFAAAKSWAKYCGWNNG